MFCRVIRGFYSQRISNFNLERLIALGQLRNGLHCLAIDCEEACLSTVDCIRRAVQFIVMEQADRRAAVMEMCAFFSYSLSSSNFGALTG
jgi:hypothetical protein